MSIVLNIITSYVFQHMYYFGIKISRLKICQCKLKKHRFLFVISFSLQIMFLMYRNINFEIENLPLKLTKTNKKKTLFHFVIFSQLVSRLSFLFSVPTYEIAYKQTGQIVWKVSFDVWCSYCSMFPWCRDWILCGKVCRNPRIFTLLLKTI